MALIVVSMGAASMLFAASASGLSVTSAVTGASILSAPAPITFGGQGEGAGRLAQPYGIAFDAANKDIYVADRNNNRVSVFSEEGEFLMAWGFGVNAQAPKDELQVCTTTTGCKSGEGGAAGGEMSSPAGIAVDNDPASGTYGNVYVVDSGNERVDEFTRAGAFVLTFGGEVNETTGEDICVAGEACRGGSEGTSPGQFSWSGTARGDSNLLSVPSSGPDAGLVYVGDTDRVQIFNAGGHHETGISLPVSIGGTRYVLANDSGGVYVRPEQLNGEGVHEYDSAGVETPPARDVSGEPYSLALGSTEELFVDDDRAGEHHIFGYDGAGSQTTSFDSGMEDAEQGMAWVEGATDALYVIDPNATIRLVTPPGPGPEVIARTLSVTQGLDQTAAVKANINPEGAETHYFIEYGLTEARGTSTPVQTLNAGFTDQTTTTQLEDLTPNAKYYYCVVAESAAGTNRSTCEEEPPRTFIAAPALAVEAEWTAEVTSGSVEFYATIDPEGSPTTCSFDYGAESEFATTGVLAHSVPASAITAPGGSGAVVSAHVQSGISPASAYVYQVSCKKIERTVAGELRHLQTSPAASTGPGLIDARVLETVTAGEGAAVSAPETGLPIAALDGRALAYVTRSPRTASEPASSRAPEPTVNLAQRGATWSAKSINVPYSEAAPSGLIGPEYRMFNEDLTAGLIEPLSRAPRPAPLAPSATEWTPYLAENLLDAPAYVPLASPADVSPGVEFGVGTPGRHGLGGIELSGANNGLSNVVVTSLVVPLLNDTVVKSLYLWKDGKLTPVSVLPQNEGGGSVPGLLGSGGGAKGSNIRGAVSEDGRLVYWSAEGHLYVTDTATGRSTRLDVPTAGASGEGPANADFQIATADGSHVFFSDTQALTPGSTAAENEEDLYECTVVLTAAAPECQLSDVTTHLANPGERADVQGRTLAVTPSERVFFVAKGALAAGARSGADNLYAATPEGDEWRVTLITVLSSEDIQDWGGSAINEVPAYEVSKMSSRATANGEYFAFMSAASPTGYDNHDVVSGALDEEAYLYRVKTGKLTCLSCAPSGERPSGVLDQGETLAGPDAPPLDQQNVWPGRWIAGMLPSFHTGPDGEGTDLDVYQPHYLDENGRTFFESATPLVREAPAPGTMGVYEYEPVGVGSCTTGSAQYLAGREGCVALLSQPDAAREAVFMDASESGADAFFMAAEKPAGGEGPAVYGIYDAHSCEAEADAACVPAGPTALAGCGTAASCKGEAGATAAPPASSPASTTFEGPGNVLPQKSAKSNAAKAKPSRAAKLKAALAACKRNKGRRRRRACEAAAHKKYGKAARGRSGADHKSKRSGR